MGEGLTLLFPISFDPVKCVDLILQMPLRKLSRGCIRGNAHTSKLKETAPPETRPLPLRRRPPGRHQPLPRRDQRRTEALHMDRRPRQNHRRRQTRAPSVRFHPLDPRRTVYLNFELSALFLHPHFPACTRVRPRGQLHRETLSVAVGARRLAPLRTVAIAVASPE